VKSSTLFDLIASLSKAEKRHFRIGATRLKADARYLRLFDIIESGRAQNDKDLRARFGVEMRSASLHVLKNYLAETILRRLRDFHSEGSATARILALIGEAEILYERELFGLSRERLRKAEALATIQESHALLCEIAAWKRALELSFPGEGLAKTVEAESKAIEDLAQVNSFWKLTAAMAADPVKAAGPVGLALRQRSGRREPYRAAVLRRHLAYAHNLVKGRTAKAERELAGLIAFMESRPDRLAEDPGSYGAALGNLIALHLQARRWDEVPKILAKIPLIPEGTLVRKSTRRMRLRLYNLELEYHRDRGRPGDARVLMKEIAAYLDQPGPPFPDDYRILFHYQFACLYFMDGNNKEALRWVNVILSDDYGGDRIELQAHARLLSLALHYDLGNLILLRYAVDGYRRFLKKAGMLDPPSSLLLRLFTRLSTAVPSEHPRIFAIVRERIERTPEAEALKDWTDFFDWPRWLGKK
jgi:hypothetical protein